MLLLEAIYGPIKRRGFAPLQDRLLRRLKADAVDDCWEWQACRDRRGYGVISPSPGRRAFAHRMSFDLLVRPIPEGMSVLHRCDNPPCCNPKHLFLGKQPDNIADMVAKGRQAKGEKVSPIGMTEEVVDRIYSDPRRQRAIAADYGISQQHVSDIKGGRCWVSPTRPPKTGKQVTVPIPPA